ncbi:LPS export ABC transporter periplasmic protein LptC [Leptolyngbya ohadii]|uniref:LPS export ABC transporter periplasmic protein LptC n=1 Tax=Leptolyngbya ohadii TaxID=1962290 RepID=UPI000B59E924|nr:LPS export ABC transporter periplasmic protein LptC [Leptolyngbya ohadii]
MGWIKTIGLPCVLLVLVGLGGCRQGSRGADRLAEDTAAAQQVDPNLTFNNITLEQPDENGKTLWKVRAKQAVYTPDKQLAKVQSPSGELYQDGKIAYRIQGREGEVRQDGDRIFLRGDVVATDVESGAVLRGNEMEWRPKQDLMIVRGNLRGTHPKLTLSANQARVQRRQQRIELLGNIIAETRDEPKLKLQGEKMVWLMQQDKLVSDRPVQVQRIANNTQVTDQANGETAEVLIGSRIATLRRNARVVTVDPPLVVTGNSLVWNLRKQMLEADQPVTVVHQQEQVTLTADRGRVDLEPRIARFTGNVRAVGQRNPSNLTSDTLVWTIPTQQLVAEGNVVYNQADPPATVRGPRAVGKLQNQTVVVSGGRVVTEIIPQNP